MTFLDYILCFWVLPSLVTLLVIITEVRFVEYKRVEDLDFTEWVGILSISFLYPIAVYHYFFVGVKYLKYALLKERKFRKS